MADYDFVVARLATTKKMPYLTQHVMSLISVPKPGLDTMGVDKWGRCYYDPAVFDKWSLDECAGVILHEDAHMFLDHHRRCKRKLGENPSEAELKVWNFAGDVSINQMLRECNVALPQGCLFPETFDVPLNLTTEEYYDLIWNQVKDKIKEGGKVPGDSHHSGSSADGMPKPWEDGPPNDGKTGTGKTPEGLDEYEQDRLRRVVAHAMDRFENSPERRGKLPGEFKRVCDEILRPAVDPRRELLSQVKYALNCTTGFGITTWKKLSRRNPPGGMRLPAHIQPMPRVCLIVDTSGSMCEKDLGLALGVIASVLKAMPNSAEGLTVIAGDTRAASCQKVFGARSVQLDGGGGTDMGAIIEEAATHKPRYDVIIVCSDGETPWGNRVDQKVVACLSRRSDYYKVPEWIKAVYIDPTVAKA